MSILAAFRLSNDGSGNKAPLPGFLTHTSCPLCNSICKLDEAHVLFTCSALKTVRKDTGISLFTTQSALLGIPDCVSHYLFVAGYDLSGERLDIASYRDRAEAMTVMRSAWLRIH